MTNNDSQLNMNKSQKQQQLAQQLYCANAAYTSVTKMSSTAKIKSSHTLVFNNIFQWIKSNNQTRFIELSPLFIQQINTNLSLRKVYLQLIKQLKFAESGYQAAASSGALLPERITEHFSIKCKRDPSIENQIYVILTINHPTENHLNHAIALHITTEEEADCLYFPLLIDGRSQLLMEEGSKHFKLLTEDNSHVYLI